jgi:hypothetical protein
MGEHVDGLVGADGGDQVSGSDLAARQSEGPDPVIGAGIALFGIFVMGLAGARNMHFVFDAGMATAVAGAVLFVLFVALSAMKQRARAESAPPSTP